MKHKDSSQDNYQLLWAPVVVAGLCDDIASFAARANINEIQLTTVHCLISKMCKML